MSEWTTETAEWYAKKHGEYATNRLAVDALKLASDAQIVDVGCGTGAALRHASRQVTRGSLIGVDPVPRMVEIARERADTHPAKSRLEFRVGPARALPVEDELADAVFAFDSYDHWQDTTAGLAEVRRVLKMDGRFVVVKDGSVPDGQQVRSAFIDSLDAAGFTVEDERSLCGHGVSFSMWECAKR